MVVVQLVLNAFLIEKLRTVKICITINSVHQKYKINMKILVNSTARNEIEII